MSDFKTSELRDTSQELQELRAQLKEAQKAAEFNFQQYQDAGRLLCDAHEQLAASQLREQQLREALDNHSGNYKLSKEECKRIDALLDAPSDTAALEALIQKAGEVATAKARQACIDLGAKGIDYFNYTSFVEAIRALPAITLKDIIK